MNITLCDRCEGRDAKAVEISITADIDNKMDLCGKCHKELADWLREFFRPLAKVAVAKVVPSSTASPFGYGYCPICGSAGISRERRPDGNDMCSNGHTYLSRSSTNYPFTVNP